MAIGALVGLGLAGWNAYQGAKDNKRANQMQQREMAQREREYTERAPMRRLGMQALGQIERPMDLGNLGFDSSNPYARARGPAPSTASYGNWGAMTYDTPSLSPEQETQQTQRSGLQALGQQLGGSRNRHLRQVGQRASAAAGAMPAGPQTTYGWERDR